MYYIIEIQKQLDGSCAHLIHTADAANQADSVYYGVISAAAISEVPQHSVVMFSDAGTEFKAKCYQRQEEATTEE